MVTCLSLLFDELLAEFMIHDSFSMASAGAEHETQCRGRQHGKKAAGSNARRA